MNYIWNYNIKNCKLSFYNLNTTIAHYKSETYAYIIQTDKICDPNFQIIPL